jgi:hypothetical protein
VLVKEVIDQPIELHLGGYVDSRSSLIQEANPQYNSLTEICILRSSAGVWLRPLGYLRVLRHDALKPLTEKLSVDNAGTSWRVKYTTSGTED